MRRILLAQTSFLGDVVLTTPLFASLRSAFPEAEIWWLVRPDAAPLVRPLVGSERVLVLDKRGTDRSLASLWRRARELRSHEFDVALAVQRSLRTALLLALAGVPRRIGFAGTLGAWLYHETVPAVGGHAIDRLLCLRAPLLGEAPSGFQEPTLVVDGAAAERLTRRLREAGVTAADRIAVLAPGAAWATKRWPVARFAELAAELLAGPPVGSPDSGGGWLGATGVDRVAVIGTADDRDRAAAIAAHLATLGLGAKLLDLTGRTDMAELVALIARAEVVVANDSAPGHVAAALGRPVVSLFGPTVPAQGFAPRGRFAAVVEQNLACRPCSRHGTERCPIGTHECLVSLPSARVAAAAREMGAAAAAGAEESGPPRRLAPARVVERPG